MNSAAGVLDVRVRSSILGPLSNQGDLRVVGDGGHGSVHLTVESGFESSGDIQFFASGGGNPRNVRLEVSNGALVNSGRLISDGDLLGVQHILAAELDNRGEIQILGRPLLVDNGRRQLRFV